MSEGLRKTPARHLWDLIGAPFRMALLPDKWSTRLGFTSLEDERLGAVLPEVRGRLLDVGAGVNTLVQRYGDPSSLGVDVVDWGGGATVIESSSRLPFDGETFDTVTFVACLNHIPDRVGAMREARRVLRPGGRCIVTMIDPILGGVGHKIWWYSEDKHRDVADGELDGMWSRDVIRTAESAGLRLAEHRRFLYGLNNLFLFDRG
jgi:SAM-dependent methyltransferase